MSKQPVICISNTTWFGGYTKSTVQLMSLLAAFREVLFVEYPFTVKDIATTLLHKQQAPLKKMLGIKPRLTKITTHYNTTIHHLVMPPVLPVDFLKSDAVFEFFFQYNTQLYQKHLLKAMHDLHFIDPVVITAYNPFYGLPVLGALKESCNIYYCYDGMGTRRHGIRIFDRDRRFSEKVDAVITSSNHIFNQKKEWNPHCFTVTNGVNFDSFRKWAKVRLHQNQRPKIGYLGSMDHRFDIQIIEHAVKNLPDYDFEFVGSMRNEQVKNTLSPYPNVRFHPPVAPDEVPGIMASCDAGIIPYLGNDINKNIYPLKINEYLAVGVPVVMTSFADLPEFEEFTFQTNNWDTFASSLIQSIENDSPEKITKRIAFAENNDWKKKALHFENIIEETIKRVRNEK
jgi:glycosyltransferase involved in cell wall biosynthesis